MTGISYEPWQFDTAVIGQPRKTTSNLERSRRIFLENHVVEILGVVLSNKYFSEGQRGRVPFHRHSSVLLETFGCGTIRVRAPPKKISHV